MFLYRLSHWYSGPYPMCAALHSFHLVLGPLPLLPCTSIYSILLSSLPPFRLITCPCHLLCHVHHPHCSSEPAFWFCPSWSQHTSIATSSSQLLPSSFRCFLDGFCLRPARHCWPYHSLLHLFFYFHWHFPFI